MDCQECPLYGKMEEWTPEWGHLKHGRLQIDGLYDELAALQSQLQAQDEQVQGLGAGLYRQLEAVLDAVEAVAESLETRPGSPEPGNARPPQRPAGPGLVPAPPPLLALLRQERYGLVNQVIDTLIAADPTCDLAGTEELEIDGFPPPAPEASGRGGKLPRGRKFPPPPETQGCLF